MPYSPPGYTCVPDEFFDQWLPYLHEKEIKVLLALIKIGKNDPQEIQKKTQLEAKEITEAFKLLINRKILQIGEMP